MDYLQLGEDQLRNLINSEATFTALEASRRRAGALRGSMFWRAEAGREYLVRATSKSRQTRLGARSPRTDEMFKRFVQRKTASESELRSLEQMLQTAKRYNLAARVGRCPRVLVDILNVLQRYGLEEHFLTVGTNAMYAYETAAGVRIEEAALATRDVDILFDTRKRLTFSGLLKDQDMSFIDILRKADKTFRVRDDQPQTAVNASGFEVDVIRRIAKGGDPHPLRMRDHDDDLWAVQVGSGDKMLSAARYSHVVVATDGSMARMTTIAPAAFVRVKKALAKSATRDPLKRGKDALQARIVQQLIDERSIELRGAVASPAR